MTYPRRIGHQGSLVPIATRGYLLPLSKEDLSPDEKIRELHLVVLLLVLLIVLPRMLVAISNAHLSVFGYSLFDNAYC